MCGAMSQGFSKNFSDCAFRYFYSCSQGCVACGHLPQAFRFCPIGAFFEPRSGRQVLARCVWLSKAKPLSAGIKGTIRIVRQSKLIKTKYLYRTKISADTFKIPTLKLWVHRRNPQRGL